MDRDGLPQIPFSQAMDVLKLIMKEGDMLKLYSLAEEDDIIRYLLTVNKFYESLEVQPNTDCKSSELAAQNRCEGNKYFHGKNYTKALKLYTKSAFSAPHTDSEYSLAFAISNRSVALFHLDMFQDCVVDIDRCLNMNIPEEIKYKLHDLRAKCLMKLGHFQDALIEFRKALDYLEFSSLDEKSKKHWIKEIETSMNNARGNFPLTEIKKVTDKLPEIPRNDVIEGASSNVCINWNKSIGRHIVALQPFEVGDTIVLQKPFAFILYGDYVWNHCHHCCKRTSTLMPSEYSHRVGFCSEDCKDNAKCYHQIEWQYLHVLEEQGMEKLGYLALRILLVAGLSNIRELDSINYKNKKYGVGPTDRIQNDIQTVATLATNMHSRKPKTSLHFAVMSLYLLKVAEKGGLFGREIPSMMDKVTVGSFLFRFIQIVQCNAYTVCETLVTNDYTLCKPFDIGLGLYPTQSLLNHSCNPNTEAIYIDNRCQIRATKNISAGEEVTIDYGPVFYLQPKEERQAILKHQYFFDCKCEACLQDWPLLENLPSEYPVLKCIKCGNPMSALEPDKRGVVVCQKCHQEHNISKITNTFMKYHKDLKNSTQALTEGDIEDNLPKIIKYLILMDKYLSHPCKEFISCQATIKQCFRLIGNTVRLSNRKC